MNFISRQDGVVIIPKEKQAYAELVSEVAASLPGAIPLGPIVLQDQQSDRVKGTLQALADEYAQRTEGELSTVIGHTYFSFKDVLFDSLKVAAKAAFAAHTGDLAGMIDTAISALEMACTRFSRLSNEQVLTYWALVGLEHDAPDDQWRSQGFSVSTIIDAIEAHASISSEETIEEGLRGLIKTGVTIAVRPQHYIVAERWVK